MAQIETIFEDRRKQPKCRITKKTRLFVKFWPLLLSFTYFSVGFWPVKIFNSGVDTLYSFLAIAVAITGIFATIFWRQMFLRNIMTSLALARSASVVALAIVEYPQLPFGAIMRLTGAGVLTVIFFCLAVVEIPFIKAMSRGSD